MSHKRSVEDKRRLEKMSQGSNFPTGAYYNERKHRYVRMKTDTKWVKNISTRTIRRKLKDKDYHLQRGNYKKLFDYWWTIT